VKTRSLKKNKAIKKASSEDQKTNVKDCCATINDSYDPKE